MVCVTYIQQIYFFQHSFSYFILNKNEIRVKPGVKSHTPKKNLYWNRIHNLRGTLKGQMFT
jgi:hypothetical protein